ncbi:MAG: NusG domain II-containing protein [Clostridia bacterium]|nr:NusG domain II-containing protein [Clostridia bacterium]
MANDRARAPLFRPLDLLVLLVVSAVACLLLLLPVLAGSGTTLAVVTASGTVHYPLDEDRTITLQENGYTLTVKVEAGAVFVCESSCPEQICRRTGRIHHPGESILCSRAGVLLRIEGEGMYDAVAG